MDKSYVFILPRTEVPGRRKRFLVVEEGPKIPVIVTELSSVRQATGLITEIARASPDLDVIVDAGCDTGRDLLYRVFHFFQSEKESRRFFVSQIFHQLRESIPEKNVSADAGFTRALKGLLFGARSNGGRRPFTNGDGLIAEIGVHKKRANQPSGTIKHLSEHPLCVVPRFLMEEIRRGGPESVPFDEDAMKQDVILLATSIAKARQAPFPIGPYRWLFPENEWPANDCMHSSLHDFIFAVLDAGTRRQKKIRERFPAQSQIIIVLNRIMQSLDLQASGLFCESLCGHRYDLLCGLLQLIFETWTLSLYRDQENKPQVVDLALLSYATGKNFEKTLSSLI